MTLFLDTEIEAGIAAGLAGAISAAALSAWYALAAQKAAAIPPPGDPVKPGDDTPECEPKTAYHITKIVSSYIAATTNTYSTVTKVSLSLIYPLV